MVAFLVHQNGFTVNPQLSPRSQISPPSLKSPAPLFRGRKLMSPPPPSLPFKPLAPPQHKILPNLVISSWLWWLMRVLLANQNRGNILNE